MRFDMDTKYSRVIPGGMLTGVDSMTVTRTTTIGECSQTTFHRYSLETVMPASYEFRDHTQADPSIDFARIKSATAVSSVLRPVPWTPKHTPERYSAAAQVVFP